MNKYICKDCGQDWYSSCEIKDMANPNCDTCGGEIEDGEKDA